MSDGQLVVYYTMMTYVSARNQLGITVNREYKQSHTHTKVFGAV